MVEYQTKRGVEVIRAEFNFPSHLIDIIQNKINMTMLDASLGMSFPEIKTALYINTTLDNGDALAF